MSSFNVAGSMQPIVLALIAVTMLSCQIPGSAANPPTTVVVPPDLGPAPDQIPANPLQIVTMRPGLPVVNEVHRDFLAKLPGYVAGSARVDAVYPGKDGDLFILLWHSNDRQSGALTCRTTAPPDGLPQGFGCDAIGEVVPFTIDGYSYTSGPGPQRVMVEHSPDADATVIELADRTNFVIRPGGSSVSYHTWDGPRPIRITVFWSNGTSTSEVLAP